MKTILLLIAVILVQAYPCYATTYSYDTLNRLTHVVYDNGNYVDYSYDAGGNIAKVDKTVVGACGSSNGGTFASPPLTNLCSNGTVSGSGSWSWICEGSGTGGSNANCSANIQTYAVTFSSAGNGSLIGTVSQAVNYGALSTEVTAVASAGYHFVNWTEGATEVSTTAALAISNVTASHTFIAHFAADPTNGACGISNGGTFRVAPAESLCNITNSTTNVTGSGPWNWDCTGSNGGTNANCSASIDITGPALVVSTLANGAVTNNATLNISGTVSDPSGVASLKINDTTVTITNGSFSYAVTLQVGANNISTVATDTLGNTSSDNRTITLDVTAPELTVTSPADNSKTAQSIATFSGAVNEAASVTISVNSGSAQNVSLSGSSFSTDVNLAVGLNSIAITTTDLAGNTASVVRSITYDNSNPSLAITNPSQDIATTQDSVSVSGTVNDTLTTATVTVAFNNQTYIPVITNGAFSQQLTMPAAGNYVITATATDEVGNSSTVVRNILYTPPVNGTCGTSNNAVLTSAPTTNLCSSGTATPVTGTGPWNWSCTGLNSGATATCSADIQSYTALFQSGSNGGINGVASQTINYGGSTSEVTAVAASGYHFVNWSGNGGFVTTTTNPLTVTNVTAQQTITANFAANPVTGACGGSNGVVFRFAPAINLCSSGTASAVSSSVTWGWSCNGSNGGSTATCSASIDITGPLLTVSTLANDAITNNSILNVSGTVSDSSGVAGITINNATVTIAGDHFSFPVVLQAGDNIISVIATDTLGNSTSDIRTITLDTTAPDLTITTPADNSKTAQQLASISGTVNKTSVVTVTVNNGIAQNASINGTAYSATVNLNSGINTITVTATDLAGNTSSVIRTVTYDNSTPSLAITNPNQDITTAQNSLTLTGTVSDIITTATVAINFNNQTLTPPVTNGTFSQLLTFPSEGNWPITATATDEVGNNVSVTRHIIYAIPINGVCGTSSNATLTAVPSNYLCNSGTASQVTGTGPWSWTCSSTNGGTTANCTANIQTYSITFTNSTGGILSGSTSQTVNHGASTTSVAAVEASGYHFVNWTGTGGFVSTTANPLTISSVAANQTVTANFVADLVAVNGSCGSSSGSTFTVIPTSNLCSNGTATTVTGSGPWTWNCSGSNGGTTSNCNASASPAVCTAVYDPVCGVDGKTYGNSCEAGLAGVAVAYNGACLTTVNGTCGSSNGSSLSIAPVSNLCTTGSATVVSGSGPWSWVCAGLGGGTTATCGAAIQYVTVTPITGSGYAISPATVQLINLNSTTSFTVTPATGYGIAAVTGCYGALNGNTYHTGLVSTDCLITVTAVARTASVNGAPPSLGDALKVLQAFSGITTLTAAEQVRYDVAPLNGGGTPQGNGVIDASDIILILRRSVGIGSW